MREKLQFQFRNAPWIDLTRAFRSSYKRERDPISSDMEEQIELETGGRIGRQTAQRIFVSAELDGEEPLTHFRQKFTEEDKKTIFWRPVTRLHRRLPSSGDPYADWKRTPQGLRIFREMQRARQEGDARRDEQERLQMMEMMNQESESESEMEEQESESDMEEQESESEREERLLNNALRWASANGRDDLVTPLLGSGGDVHFGDDVALRMASRYGHEAVVRILLDHGADVHANDDVALLLASEEGHENVVRMLLERGADVHARDGAALRRASANGQDELVAYLLLERGADVHAGDDQALLLASQNGHDKVVRMLLDHGAVRRSGRRRQDGELQQENGWWVWRRWSSLAV
jgi:hypothetical protein